MMPKSLFDILDAYKEEWFDEYQNKSHESLDTITQFKALLLDQDAPFSRNTFPNHFTASCFVVNPSFSKILLLKHRKLEKWLQMGGHCDGEINLAEVALKEAREESGSSQIQILNYQVIDLDIHVIPQNIKEPEHKHFDVRYLGFCAETDPLEKSERECTDLQWFTWEEARKRTTEESMHRVFNKIQFLLQKGVLS
jgi:8-oxo-dGTP pyrophosphatase MutT (NUDIX family)